MIPMELQRPWYTGNMFGGHWKTVFDSKEKKKYSYESHIYTAGKISIEHVTIFLSKYISKGAVDMKLSPDVGNNPSNPYIQKKQNK